MSACLAVLLGYDEPRRKFVADLRRAGVPVLALVVEEAPKGEKKLEGAIRLPPAGLAAALAGVPSGPGAWAP